MYTCSENIDPNTTARKITFHLAAGLLLTLLSSAFIPITHAQNITSPTPQNITSPQTTPPAPPPPAISPSLTTSQKERLFTAKDNSTTIDEAAFFALLENLSKWTPQDILGNTPGVIPPPNEDRLDPNFPLIRQTPENYRGKIFTVVGKLIMARPVENLSRKGWKNVFALTLQIGDLNKSASKLTNDDMVIVYLTAPPTFTIPILDLTGQPAEAGTTLRIYTRFYKPINLTTRSGKQKTYLTFVGQTIEGTLIKKSNSSTFVVIGLVLFLFGGFLYLQLYNKRKSKERTLARQERARQRIQDKADEPDYDLPKDPIDALTALKTLEESPDEDQLQQMQQNIDPVSSLDQLKQQTNPPENEQ